MLRSCCAGNPCGHQRCLSKVESAQTFAACLGRSYLVREELRRLKSSWQTRSSISMNENEELEADVTYIFANNLLQGVRQNPPWEHFDILFNVSWLWAGEAHDDFEKLFAIWSRL